MKLCFGLRMCKNYFDRQGWKRKKMVAALAVGNKLVLASNLFKTHPSSKSRENFIHAELAVLRHLSPEDENGILYIYRTKHNGNLGMSRPCSECWDLIRATGKIKKVVYTTEFGTASERVL